MTNQYNFNNNIKNNKFYFAFSKLTPFREVERQDSFQNKMIYNPGKVRKHPILNPTIFMHHVTCAEVHFSKLIKTKNNSSLPSLLLINSANCEINSRTFDKITKHHHYLFQVDSVNNCQYDVLKRPSKAMDVNFYKYNIYHFTLEKADLFSPDKNKRNF